MNGDGIDLRGFRRGPFSPPFAVGFFFSVWSRVVCWTLGCFGCHDVSVEPVPVLCWDWRFLAGCLCAYNGFCSRYGQEHMSSIPLVGGLTMLMILMIGERYIASMYIEPLPGLRHPQSAGCCRGREWVSVGECSIHLLKESLF
jgi:hypothetical protein